MASVIQEHQFANECPPNPLAREGYRLEFHDEFDGPTLDTTKWFPFYLPHWSSRERTVPRYKIENGNLVLQISEDQPAWCPEFDGEVRCSSIQTGEFAGPVGSKIGQLRFSDACLIREAQTNIRTYTPQYGYRTRHTANHVAFWMIGYEDLPERSGEIAIFELVGGQASPTVSGVRFGVHPWSDPNLTEEFYQGYFKLDVTEFHIYGLEWTPNHIDFYIDNLPLKRLTQSPNYPMQFMLAIYEHPFEGAWTGPHDWTAAYPKQFTIDYFRAYQPFEGYST